MKAREAAVKDWDAKLKKRHDRLGALEQELEASKVELDVKARVLAKDRVAFAEMEEKARASLKTLYRAAWRARWPARRTAPSNCFPSWSVHLKMLQTALVPRPRPRRMSFLLRR